MKELKIKDIGLWIDVNNDGTTVGFTLFPKEWEKIKKNVDNELYKKFNKNADYSEIRFYIEPNQIDVEAHCLKDD